MSDVREPSDDHRTGCGCAERCGPARADPLTMEDAETHQLRNERDELQRRITRALTVLDGDTSRTALAAVRLVLTGGATGTAGHD